MTDHATHALIAAVEGCPMCDYNKVEDARITATIREEYPAWTKVFDAAETLRDRYPGYLYDGRDGSIEAEDDDEDHIAAEDAAREEWAEYLEWQRGLME